MFLIVYFRSLLALITTYSIWLECRSCTKTHVGRPSLHYFFLSLSFQLIRGVFSLCHDFYQSVLSLSCCQMSFTAVCVCAGVCAYVCYTALGLQSVSNQTQEGANCTQLQNFVGVFQHDIISVGSFVNWTLRWGRVVASVTCNSLLCFFFTLRYGLKTNRQSY